MLENQGGRESSSPRAGWTTVKPYLAMVFLQFGFAGMSIIAMAALKDGMSPSTFVVYRHAIATLAISPFAFACKRNSRPKMTLSIFLKIMALGFLEPVLDQNLFYTGMKHTSATFTAAMGNVLPAVTFIMACIFRLERVNMTEVRSVAKVAGTIVSVAGAMVMTLYHGPVLHMPWIRGEHHHVTSDGGLGDDVIKGSIMLFVACSCWAGFVILQAFTLREYPVEITVAALICAAGAAQGSIAAVLMNPGNRAIWSIKLDKKLLAMAYAGVVLKERGPVFVTAFSPLGMIIVTVLGSIVLEEDFYLGMLIGAIVIVSGLYLVVWGKSKDVEHLKCHEEQ
ncbi:WAT1-related protein [Acorus gramineus]|uniref:WAT1-related protein n=1 Tax=Acorus gramineus TaxID=55184 RepID=A0AAV9BTW9_ACOGR|nr:WAT1-related protein [Acorus gramineus]